MAKPKVLTVGQLSLLLQSVLEEAFPEVWVAGEVSNLSRPSSGHLYFTLKDDEAQIRGVIWRSTAERMRFDIEEGMQLICSGRIDLYPPRGSYQLVVRSAEPLGMGPLQIAFRQLHDKLQQEGLFARQHKQPLPAFPRRIGVITSPTGAAIRDFLQILNRRWNQASVLIMPARVQGEGSAAEIAEAVRVAQTIRPPLDVLVLTRGGGSMEDLWSFNEEPVVRAIHASRIPTISAVGHEIDVTLSDLAADVRALTPSEAAEKVVPSRDEILRRIRQLKNSLDQRLLGKLEMARNRLVQLESRPVLRRPLDRIRDLQRRLDDLETQAQRSIRRSQEKASDRLAALARQLDAVSPLSILQRGYSLTQLVGEPMQLVKSIEQLQPGDLIETQVANGTFRSRVER